MARRRGSGSPRRASPQVTDLILSAPSTPTKMSPAAGRVEVEADEEASRDGRMIIVALSPFRLAVALLIRHAGSVDRGPIWRGVLRQARCFASTKSFSSSGSGLGLGLGPRNGSRSPGRNGPCPCSSSHSQSVNAACPRVSWHILVLGHVQWVS